MSARAINLVGRFFGRLLVLYSAPPKGVNRSLRWVCRCTCGSLHEASSLTLRRGSVQSCGCAKGELISARTTQHGETRGRELSPEFRSWTSMRARCRDPNAINYHRYGGRGITVCDRWHSFSAFLEDMGRKPTPAHTIDRVNNDGNYEPGNCRWATAKEQIANRPSRKGIPCTRT